MKIKIITDSTSDISKEYAIKNDISVLPIGIEIEGDFYREGIDITPREFYDKLKVAIKLPHTSQINEYAFCEIIDKYKNTDTFFCIMPLSKELSNTYYSAENAIKNYPDERFFLCETMTATVGLAMLIDYANTLSKKDNMTPETFISEIEQFKTRIAVYGLISELKYLKMGGRLTAGASLIGTILKISPLVTINGKVQVVSKHIGKSKCFAELANLVAQRDYEYPVFIGHSDCKDMTNQLIEKEKDILKLDGRACYFDMGAAIGTHSGPGAVVMAFIKKK